MLYFFPLGDDNTYRRTTPFIVWLLVALNGIAWFLQLSLGDEFTLGFSAIPYEIVNGVDLVRPQLMSINGSQTPIPQAPGPNPIFFTILSSMFLHGSWSHILGNMLYLIIFGDQIEDLLGHGKFLIFYLLSGVSASFTHIAFDASSIIPSLGASGAIAGVLGAYLLKYPKNRVRVLLFRQITYLPAVIVLGGWILIQIQSQISVFSGTQSGVAYLAHIGGFVAGLILISIFPRRLNS